MNKVLKRTDQSGDCLIWNGAVMKDGYGNIYHEGKYWRAHRLSYFFEHGEIPAGMYVCHTCDTPLCVNPDHLFLGTCADNLRDMTRKLRNNMQALTPKIVREIRASDKMNVELAVKYDVSPSAISKVRIGRTWSHVT